MYLSYKKGFLPEGQNKFLAEGQKALAEGQKALAEGQSPPQEQEVSPRSGLYLLVLYTFLILNVWQVVAEMPIHSVFRLCRLCR